MINRILAILPVVALLSVACSPDASKPTGVVIVNARVIDGSGGPSRNANVRIVGERIDRLGDFEPSAKDTMVDADGLVLAPGFVDTHSHHEDRLLETPGALATVNQGITTIAGGQDGGQKKYEDTS